MAWLVTEVPDPTGNGGGCAWDGPGCGCLVVIALIVAAVIWFNS